MFLDLITRRRRAEPPPPPVATRCIWIGQRPQNERQLEMRQFGQTDLLVGYGGFSINNPDHDLTGQTTEYLVPIRFMRRFVSAPMVTGYVVGPERAWSESVRRSMVPRSPSAEGFALSMRIPDDIIIGQLRFGWLATGTLLPEPGTATDPGDPAPVIWPRAQRHAV